MKKTDKITKEAAVNNAIKHDFIVNNRYMVGIWQLDPNGEIEVKWPSGHISRFRCDYIAATYVGGDHVDNEGMMMAMFRLDHLPWLPNETNVKTINGFKYDRLEDLQIKPI